MILVDALAGERGRRKVRQVLPHFCEPIERCAETYYVRLRSRMRMRQILDHALQVCVERDTSCSCLISQSCFDFRF